MPEKFYGPVSESIILERIYGIRNKGWHSALDWYIPSARAIGFMHPDSEELTDKGKAALATYALMLNHSP